MERVEDTATRVAAVAKIFADHAHDGLALSCEDCRLVGEALLSCALSVMDLHDAVVGRIGS